MFSFTHKIHKCGFKFNEHVGVRHAVFSPWIFVECPRQIQTTALSRAQNTSPRMKASDSRASDSDVSYCPWTTYAQRSAECGVCATSLWMMWQETLPEKSENTLIGTYVWKTKVKRDSLVDLERNQQEWDLAGGWGDGRSSVGSKHSQTWFLQESHKSWNTGWPIHINRIHKKLCYEPEHQFIKS